MAAMALLMHSLTPASRTRLTTSHLKDFSEATSSKSGVALAKLLLISHKPTDLELQESRLRLKKSLEGLKQGTTQMEMFIAKYMQVYKDLLDVDYTLDDLETRVNFRKALSTAFLEIFDAKTDHILPSTLEECYEHAIFAASVIKARRPALDRIPNHSKPLNAKPSDRSTKPHGKKSTSSQPQGRKVVHSSRDNAAKLLEETSTLNKLSRDGSVEKHWVVLFFILPSANLHVYKLSGPNSYPLPYSRGSIYRVT